MDKKSINRISVFLIIISFTVIFAVPVANAGDFLKEFPAMMCDQINTGVIDVVQKNLSPTNALFYAATTGKVKIDETTETKVAVDPSTVNSAAGNGAVTANTNNTNADATNGNANTKKEGSSALDAIGTFMTFEYGIAGIIVTIFCFYGMVDNIAKGQDPMQCIEKTLLEVSLSMVLFINIPTILGYIVDIGVEFINTITKSVAGVQPEGITCNAICGQDNPKGTKWLKCIIVLLIPWVASVFMSVAAKVISYSLILEIGVRRAFAPLACCDIVREGLRSPGVRYLKKYFACFLKICACLMICLFVNACSSIMITSGSIDDPVGFIEYVISTIAFGFAALEMMFKTGEIVNDVVGVL